MGAMGRFTAVILTSLDVPVDEFERVTGGLSR